MSKDTQQKDNTIKRFCSDCGERYRPMTFRQFHPDTGEKVFEYGCPNKTNRFFDTKHYGYYLANEKNTERYFTF